VPNDSEEVKHVATPANDGTTAVQPEIAVPSAVKATVPESAVPPDGAETVAVNVTDWFTLEGLGVDASAVVVAALLTVCVSVAELEE